MSKRADSLSASGPSPARPRGLLFVVSSPSGAGKTTLARRLLAEHAELRFSVSYTTRARRGREQDGVDYHFVGDSTFDQMVSDGAFAEWCPVHGRRYGTSREITRGALDSGQQLLLDIDYQGAEKLQRAFPDEARLVYILPPSLQALDERLRMRATDSAAVIEARLRQATEELRHYPLYDYLVLNRDLNEGYAELEAIYRVETAHFRGTEPDAATVALSRKCRRDNRTELAEKILASAVSSVDEAALPSSSTPKVNPWP